MLSTTLRRKLLVAVLIALVVALAGVAGYYARHAVLVARLSDAEKKIVGAWSWTYIEGVGRMIFGVDRRVKEGFPPDDPEKPAVHDADFTYLLSGIWHVEGDILVTDISNQPLIDGWGDLPAKPALERKVRREKIVSIDDKKIVFGDGSSLNRVHP